MEFLIISGQSGAGKSRVADMLEDLDFYCVDNMPAELLPRFAELCLATRGRYSRVALVIDARERVGFEALFRAAEQLEALGCTYRLLFVEASTEAILHRYKESRRPHPLAAGGLRLEEAILREAELLRPVRERADFIINTSGLTLSQLQRQIRQLFMDGVSPRLLDVRVVAFGFKFGIPMEADLVFDMRFLPNPYYVAELKELDGLNKSVADYVLQSPASEELMERLTGLIKFLLPQYVEDGRHDLTIAVGCTGGRHRSVAVAAELADFVERQGATARLVTRDIDRR